MTDGESLEKLLVYQQDLVAEEECIKKMIDKLNAQAHALQVEQLHILNAINSKVQETNETTTNGTNALLKKEIDPLSQKLDLTVSRYQSSEEDEDDMED
ncbi:uncharacterized protein LOC131664863 [Phymastichus coffea]|uniref:uncharacterized protein LOC131664863 n=1 Tax=Phymastichus coffea TaxID=108790 RepID=UPI00273A9932|nr:uncharacterized protein LOC131664863 [Phymastichus coffea]